MFKIMQHVICLPGNRYFILYDGFVGKKSGFASAYLFDLCSIILKNIFFE